MTAPCNCDQAMQLRAELDAVRAERDYLLAFHDASEIRQMRAELRAEWEQRQGYLPEAERVDFEEVLP